ncbi:MAG: SLBB domain-containing protein [Sandaracinus sp.]|nr:SLBB domain-containing protein [Sandaracinus sp.]MCB9634238.1 SLBB domain-containing protein [Sandaracinus sp.]
MRVVLVASLLAVGCVRLPDAPTLPTDDPQFQPAQVEAPAGVTQDPPAPLAVLPGDVLSISVLSTETTVWEGLAVDELGRVHLPLAGTVEIGGLPLAEAERRIEASVREVDRVSRVALRIAEPAGHMATVLGAVESPGRVNVVPGMRLADLVATVGGLVESLNPEEPTADLAAARLVRGGQAVPVSLARAVAGEAEHNVRVRPGDHLHVPYMRTNMVVVLGSVGTPTVLAHRADMRLSEALARAGGVNERGDRTDVHIVRGPLDQPLVYRTSLRAIVNGNERDVVLAAGDVVYVTEEWTSHVGEVLTRISSLLTTPATVALTAAIVTQ